MRTSYGVVWRVGEEPLARGKLERCPESCGSTASRASGREPVVVSAVAQAGVIAELTEHIAKLTLD